IARGARGMRKNTCEECPECACCSGLQSATGVDRNRTDWERCSHPPLVLKTRANTSCANTPRAIPPIVRPSELSALLAIDSQESNDTKQPAPRLSPPRRCVSEGVTEPSLTRRVSGGRGLQTRRVSEGMRRGLRTRHVGLVDSMSLLY